MRAMGKILKTGAGLAFKVYYQKYISDLNNMCLQESYYYTTYKGQPFSNVSFVYL